MLRRIALRQHLLPHLDCTNSKDAVWATRGASDLPEDDGPTQGLDGFAAAYLDDLHCLNLANFWFYNSIPNNVS